MYTCVHTNITTNTNITITTNTYRYTTTTTTNINNDNNHNILYGSTTQMGNGEAERRRDGEAHGEADRQIDR